ncbi:MAG: heme-binding domain-containing protein [Verrucomicrobia bacterium]|nr:heme-binding domain-containing protein [Verrucomicrobiota bacterium]
MVKKVALILVFLLVAIQLVRPEKNLSSTVPKTDFLTLHPPSAEVKHLLQVGCYDCHSDHTRYPWYAEIQPIGWWLAQHVRDGKRELNLSSFGELSRKRQAGRIEEMIDVIARRDMPLKSYTLTHRDAVYTEAQIKQINDWLEKVRDKVAPEE